MLSKTFLQTMFLLFTITCFLACSSSESTDDSTTTATSSDENAGVETNEATEGQDVVSIQAVIDKAANDEIKSGTGQSFGSMLEYYAMPAEDYENWSGRMFGRCCTEVDMTYGEALVFKFSTDSDNVKYPLTNLSDTKYNTAFVFKENQDAQINIQLNDASGYFDADSPKSPKNYIGDDVLIAPFTISLINGYAKSKSAYDTNGRVKEMDVLHNGEYKGTVTLKDTPDIQKFSIDTEFKKDDTITLMPKTYYSGSKYEDVCITEIQSNLGSIVKESINEKYTFY